MIAIKVALFSIVAYLIAGIPFAYIISKKFLKIDIRNVGSGNVGATNVYRAGGLKLAVAVFILDFLKGLVPTIASVFLFNKSPEISTLIAISCVFGHMFTPYLKFQGGKGAATSFGAFIVIFPSVVIICALLFLISVKLSHIVALGTIVAAVTFPIVYYVISKYLHITFPFESFSVVNLILIIIVAVFIIFKHRSNIMRMFKGNENKI